MVLLYMLFRRLFFDVLSFDLAIFFLSLAVVSPPCCLIIRGDLVGKFSFCLRAASMNFFLDSLSLDRPPRSLFNFLLYVVDGL